MSFSDHQQQDVQIDTSEYDEYANGPFSFSEQELEMKDHHQEDMYFSDQQHDPEQHGNGNRNSSLTILGQFDDDEDADGNGGAMSKGKSWIQTLWFSLSIFFVVVATVMVRVFMFWRPKIRQTVFYGHQWLKLHFLPSVLLVVYL